MKKLNKTPLAAAMGAALLSSFAPTAANAEANPFAATELSTGYMQLAEMKCGASMGMGDAAKKTAEGACAGNKATAAAKKVEGKCGEGKCGGKMKEDMMKAKEGSCGKACADNMKNCEAAKTKEGACGANMKGCGEGMSGCTEMMKSKDGSCGAAKKATEAAPAAAPAVPAK